MNFTLKLAVSEIIKNKSKVLIAIIVTLILFMSAFTLCNIATALPNNFYRYYEDYMTDSIGVYISNADKELYETSSNYFEEFIPNLQAATWFDVLQHNGNKQLPYGEHIDEEGNVEITDYFKVLLDEYQIENYNSDEYAQFFDSEIGGSGQVWPKDGKGEGIWISDLLAQAPTEENGYRGLDVSVGDSIDYVFNDIAVKLEVKGIYSHEKLYEYMNAKSDVFEHVAEFLLFITNDSAKKILFESNSSFTAYGVIGKIDRLYDVYNELYTKYSLSEGLVFSLITQVKNAQIICMIIGVIMLICGIVIMLNFINMIISQNVKHISLLRILGTSTFRIMAAYFMIFMLLITIVCLISWMTLPLYNYFVSLYCTGLGYPFQIGISYAVVAGVFAICYFIITAVMLVKWKIMDSTSPIKSITEED